MKILVGYTGFVGSNLARSDNFDYVYNSKNVQEAYGSKPDLLIYAGVTGTKYLANFKPAEDQSIINAAITNIKNISPDKLVLISTVDVNSSLQDSDEDSLIKETDLHPYGKHRLQLERWVIENIKDYHIIRLPAIYGKNLKKNFIYDMMHRTPSILSHELYDLLKNDVGIYYDYLNENFMKLRTLNLKEAQELERYFYRNNINSLQFTDSRSRYQYYNLKNLSPDIKTIIDHNIKLINLVTEPISASDLYHYLYNKKIYNITKNNYVDYGLKTKYAEFFEGEKGFIKNKKEVLYDIKEYISNHYSGLNTNGFIQGDANGT